MQSTSNQVYEEITNFFGRFDPQAQLFDNTDDMNTLAHINSVTLGPPIVIEHTMRVMIPSSKNDLHSQNLHAKGGPILRFDSKAGPSKIRGNYRSHFDIQQNEANA